MSAFNRSSGDGNSFVEERTLSGWCPKCGRWKTLCEETNKFRCTSPNCGVVEVPDGDSPYVLSD